jgi:replicative DNA helicase
LYSGCCILAGKSFNLSPNIFRKTSHLQIMQAILDLAKRDEPINLASVYQATRQYHECPDAYHMAWTVENTLPYVPGNVPLDIQVFYQRQALQYHKRFLLFEMLASTKTLDRNVDEIIARIDERLEQLKKYDTDLGDGRRSSDIVKDYYVSMDIPQPIISTGIQTIDNKLGGGFEPGTIAIIAARPSVGKTAMAVSMIMATKHKHLFFSLEMAESQIIRRMVCWLTGIKYAAVNNPRYADRTKAALDKLRNRNFVVSDKTGITLSEIEIMVEREQPDIVWVDYLQLMRGAIPGRQFHSREDEVSTYSAWFKGLAKRYGVLTIKHVKFPS